MKHALLFFFLIFAPLFFGQENSLEIKVDLLFNGEKAAIEKWYKLNEHDSIQIESLRFYLSDFELTKKGKSIWQEKESYHLVDLEVPNSSEITLNFAKNLDFDGIRFHLGIDSLTNSGGVKGGDLDPTKGMYWTWQTGYIHFKLEGKSNLCATRNNQFTLHLGGYSFPQNTLQTLNFDLQNKEKIVLELDLGRFIGEIDLRNTNHIMSPGAEAVKLSQQAATIFQLR